MPLLLLLAFLVVPVVELAVIITVGRQIGGLWTIALLVVISIVGAVLVRREGSRAWRNLSGALGSGRLPANEVADGALVVFGGALLLTPGFLSDLLGLLCLLPPTRVVLRRLLLRVVAKRFVGAPLTGFWSTGRGRPGPVGRGRRGAGPSAPPRPDIIDGELDDPPRTDR